jgi:ribosomal protein S20
MKKISKLVREGIMNEDIRMLKSAVDNDIDSSKMKEWLKKLDGGQITENDVKAIKKAFEILVDKIYDLEDRIKKLED